MVKQGQSDISSLHAIAPRRSTPSPSIHRFNSCFPHSNRNNPGGARYISIARILGFSLVIECPVCPIRSLCTISKWPDKARREEAKSKSHHSQTCFLRRIYPVYFSACTQDHRRRDVGPV